MARPTKEKIISKLPKYQKFCGEKKSKEKIILLVEEYETIRLIDYLGYSQDSCAKEMDIARTSVQSLYSNARRKIARFLTEGIELVISGGNYQLKDSTTIINEKGDGKMVIAVTYEDGNIFQHFGKTEFFKIYKTQGENIISEQIINTNGNGHGALASFLKEYNVEILICGGIGSGAKNTLAENNIKIYPGAIGNADKQVKAFLEGNLDYNPDTTCNHHHDENHSCSDHHENDGTHSCGHHK
ncbi:DUF134 domain-containing protein [Fusobacterium sp. PH5-44]|uniref:DUF134 domain-containing protein n=1 Tax=unclassified Fusobacterium TaxID=2648384 RepID=UPI003D24E986